MEQITQTTTDEFRKVVFTRRSIRSFRSTPVPKPVLRELLQLTRRAPSCFNSQPYAGIIVQDRSRREALSTAMLGGNVETVKNAPMVMVFAADLEPMKRVPQIQLIESKAGMDPEYVAQLPFFIQVAIGESTWTNPFKNQASSKTSLATTVSPQIPVVAWAYKQTMLAAGTFLLAATAHGLASCPMEGFDQEKVKQCLDIPARYSVPVIIALGYPVVATSERDLRQTPRLPLSDMFFMGKFGRSYH